MRSRPSALQVGAVALAATLISGYVWFRVSESHKSVVEAPVANTPASAPSAPSTSPTVPPAVMSGTKFSRLSPDPYPSTNAIGVGFKLNNSISAEFAVGADTKVGIIDLIPNQQPSTRQTTAPNAK